MENNQLKCRCIHFDGTCHDCGTKLDNVPQVKTVEQPFEKYEELTAILYHAAHVWRTDMQWTPLLSEINSLCIKISELENENKDLKRNYDLNVKDYGNLIDEKDNRIAELEAELLHQKEQNKRISNQIELSEEANAIVRYELEAENAKLREALECVRSMSSSVSIEQNRKIRFFITEALNSKDAGGE